MQRLRLSLLLTTLLATFYISGSAQLSGSYFQSFEGITFPPNGWQRVNTQGILQWEQSTGDYYSGIASAFIDYEFPVGEDWLIMPKYHVSAATDSLIFYMAPQLDGYPPDSLGIRLSTTDSLTTSFNISLLGLSEGVNYPFAGVWTRYAVSLAPYVGQDIFIGFKHYNEDGDGIFIDDVRLGTQMAHDVTPVDIALPNFVVGPQNPAVEVTNVGLNTESFNVTLELPGGYTATQTANALAAGATAFLTFPQWTPPVTPGTYTGKAYSQLVGDNDLNNDTLYENIIVPVIFPQNGWSQTTPSPQQYLGQATAAMDLCSGNNDSTFIYVIGGVDFNFNIIPDVYRFNPVTNLWDQRASIPLARFLMGATWLNNKIYVPGGNFDAFDPVDDLSIYDPATNTWSAGANLPFATGDYAMATYGDSLIYVIGGYDGFDDISDVQVYNVNTNSWNLATAFPGIPVSGARAAIKNGKIVFVGGFSQNMGASLDQVWIGTINPANPLQITWAQQPAYPGGTVGRHASGVSYGNDDRVYFGGGDPDGQGLFVLDDMFAYNLATGQWEVGPSIPVPAGNFYAMVPAVRNDSLFLALIGGYDGNNPLDNNRWLGLSAVPTASVSTNDTLICAGNSATLTATGNASGYTWAPGGTLSQTTGTTVVATPTAPTTYYMNADKGFGCPILDSVHVNAAAPGTLLLSHTDITCNGDNDGIVTSTFQGGTGTPNYSWSSGPSTPTIQNLSDGWYVLTVTDSAGCVVMDSAEVLEPAQLVVTGNNGNSPGNCNGSLTANATGGTPAYTYQWNDPGSQTTQTATGLCPGTYQCIVTDANGCSDTVSLIVTGPSGTTENEIVISVYPVPADEYLVITADNQTIQAIQLFDASGRMVQTMAQPSQTATLNVEALSEGLYTLRILVGENNWINKSVIIH